MNNTGMYDLERAGGVAYPETEKYDYNKWYTTMGMTDGGAYKAVRFDVRQDNLLLHWRNSYLELKGQLVKKSNGRAFGEADLITLIHNAIPHMFSNVKLSIGSTTVETVDHPGHVSSLIYNVLYDRSKGKCDGMQFLWFPDTAGGPEGTDETRNKGFAARRKYVMLSPTTRGKFKLRLPLHMLFGFMENFVALKGYPVEIELIRGADYPAIYRRGAGESTADEGKLKFSDILLNVPIVNPATNIKIEYLKGIDNPSSYLYSFRERHGMFAPVPAGIQDFQQPIASSFFTERPQMIWIGFQTSGTTDQTVNHALYLNANVESAYIMMNNTQFPLNKFNADWDENDNGFFYEMQSHMRANYLQTSSCYSDGNMLTPANFKSLYTIYCFDVSKHEMTVGSNTVTCDLHVRFKKVTRANLRVYIAWFNDRTLELHTDGKSIAIRREIENYVSTE